MTMLSRTPEGAYEFLGHDAMSSQPPDISKGYDVRPTPNGGFIITAPESRLSGTSLTLGAFSTAQDLLDWLAEAHEVRP